VLRLDRGVVDGLERARARAPSRERGHARRLLVARWQGLSPRAEGRSRLRRRPRRHMPRHRRSRTVDVAQLASELSDYARLHRDRAGQRAEPGRSAADSSRARSGRPCRRWYPSPGTRAAGPLARGRRFAAPFANDLFV